MNCRNVFLSPMAVITLLALTLTFTSCSRTPRKDSVPVSTPMADSIRFEYAVYLLPTSSNKALAHLKRLLASKYGAFKLINDFPKEPDQMVIEARIETDVQHRYAPPSMESLQYFGRGITRAEGQALQKSRTALILTFGHPRRQAWTALRLANLLEEDIARTTQGLAWDEETREIFSPDAWHAKRLASWTSEIPDVATQTVIHAYNTGEYQRAITLGMAKMGLPDVVVEDFPWSTNDQVGNLINMFCQAIAEGKTFSPTGRFKLDLASIKNSTVRESQTRSLKSNASGTACLTLRQAKWEEGDPKNRLISLGADIYEGKDFHAKQELMISSMFGSEDSITRVRHNEELLAESRRERAKLPELQKAFNAGLQPGEFINVKAPFHTKDGGTEWMWVEVSKWKDGKIEGLLDNDPFNVPDLRAGEVVEVREEDVFDYTRHYPDKRVEGNTTGPILQKLDEGKSENAISQRTSVKCDSD